MGGRLALPTGAMFNTIDGIVLPPVKRAVVVATTPLRFSRLAEAVMACGNTYAPENRAIHSHESSAVLMNALGIRKEFSGYGMFFFVAE